MRVQQHITILMATLNGARHLSAQLESFVAQTHPAWGLHVADDGSTDATRGLVEAFARAHPQRRVLLRDGPRAGSAANFLTLLAAGGWPRGSWLAFSDQDDVWMPERLEHAVSSLSRESGPAVYASRTLLTDAALHGARPSRRHPHAPAFGNALAQNIIAGNTIVLNPAAAELAQRTATAALSAGVRHHDWWIYLLMSGAGAAIINDDRPGLYYRQHESNHLGANRGLGKAWSRFAMIWDRRYGSWLRANIAALETVSEELTPANRARLAQFRGWLEGPGRGRFGSGLARAGVWRQSPAGDLMLRLAAAAGRL